MSQSQTQSQTQTVQIKKYRLIEIKELCVVHGIPYDNDVDINPSEFVFIDEFGRKTDFIGFFEGTALLAAYESEDRLYAIIDIPSEPSSHVVELLVFERVE